MLKPALAGVTTASSSLLIDEWSIYLFNVPLVVLGMAAAGAMLSFAYDTDEAKPITRMRLYVLAFANTLLAAAAVAVFPEWLGWEWASPKLQGSMALLFAASARFFVPAFIRIPAELLRKWLRLGEYNKSPSKQEEEEKDDSKYTGEPPTPPRPKSKVAVKKKRPNV